MGWSGPSAVPGILFDWHLIFLTIAINGNAEVSSYGTGMIHSGVPQHGVQGGFLNQGNLTGSQESCQEPAAHMTTAEETWAGPEATVAKPTHTPPPSIKEAPRER